MDIKSFMPCMAYDTMPSKVRTRPIARDPRRADPICESCYDKADVDVLFEIRTMIIVRRYCQKCVETAKL